MDKHSVSVAVGFLMENDPSMMDSFIGTEIKQLMSLGVVAKIYYLQRNNSDIYQSSNLTSEVSQINEPVIVAWKNVWSIIIELGTGILRYPFSYLKILMRIIWHPRGEKSTTLIKALQLCAMLKRHSIEHLHVFASGRVLEVVEYTRALIGISYSVAIFSKEIQQCKQNKTIRCLEKAEFIITTTEYDRRQIQSICSKKTPIYRIHQSVNPEVFNFESPKSDSAKQGGLMTILSVGPLIEETGFTDLIYACKLLKEAQYAFQCNIVGVGPEQKSLQRLIQKFELDEYIYLRGRMNPLLMQAVYQRTNIFVLPCHSFCTDQHHHRIPASLLEAMAFAVPVISTRLPAIAEVIENQKNGLIVEPNSPLQIAKALITLSGNKQTRSRIGIMGYHKVDRCFRADRNAAILKTLLVRQKPGDENISFQKLVA